MPALSRDRYSKRRAAMRAKRSSYDEHWRDLGEHILPRRTRFNDEDANKGDKRNDKIYNGTATQALNILAAGMMAGLSSPSRPWFKLVLTDKDAASRQDVQAWLVDVRDRMLEVMAASNVYSGLHNVYRDIGCFGTSAMIVEEDADGAVINVSVAPIGSYCLATNFRNEVDTIYRDTTLTVEQLVSRFGKDAVSAEVLDQFENGNLDQTIRVVHVIEPNDARHTSRSGAAKRWRSVWYERDSKEEKLLDDRGGFNEFPVMAPRWSVNGENVYGDSPAMDALGDIRGLQKMEYRGAQALNKIVNPPMKGSASLKTQRMSLLSGDITYLDDTSNGMFEPAHVVDSRVVMLEKEILRKEQKINGAFLANIFLAMFSNVFGRDRTAREVEEIHQEKMLQLGPTLERVHNELLSRLIARLYEVMTRFGMIPPAPSAIQGLRWDVKFISALAEAQKLVGTVSIERLLQVALQIAPDNPEIWDVIDLDRTMVKYADLLGNDPELLRSAEEVKARRDQRAAQQEAAAAAAVAKDAGSAAQSLGNAQLTDDVALGRLMQGAGVGAPSAGGIAA